MVEIVRGAEWRDEQVWHLPERRGGRQRLRIEHVEDRPRELAALQRLGELGIIDDAGPADIDQPGASLHRGNGAGIDQVMGVGGEWRRHQHEVGLGQSLVQLAERQHGVGMAVRPRIAAHAEHTHAEPLGRPRRGAAHIAQPHYQQSLSDNARREDRRPRCLLLVVQHLR